ncbi:hypothetical protein [Nocardioides baculatus]|uniref:Glycosyltransferase RgtA/B/C/D-like domain-containing protein n=1 Tax=Nocardioides baculatus TaxID=2801337 RepID=A0ABS1L710_9ACTN|nr:hypothetical protein [Nocardioides baculatus]MBL0747453.1 hypothetical protein [Nocardioides baculatus]
MTTFVRRVAPFLGVAGLMLGFGLEQRVPPATGDMWFHLRLGEEFLNGWSIRHPGHLGRLDSADWVPTQWLSQVAMAWGADRGGPVAVVWATGVVLILLVLGTYVVCRDVAAPLPAAIAVTLGMFAASPGFSARPQVLSYVFLMATAAAWLRMARDGRPRYWLIPIAWAWPMCHGLWPVGLSVSVAAFAAVAIERNVPLSSRLRMGGVVAASFVVSGLTPIGLDAYATLFVAGSRREYFAEWGAPDFTSPATAVLAVMIIVVVAAGLRRRPVPWTEVAITTLAIAWSLYSLRTTVVGSLLLTPILAATLGRLAPASEPVRRHERLALLALAFASSMSIAMHLHDQPSRPVVPQWVDAQLDALPADTKVLNDWDSGSYFVYRHPDLSWAMHGYGDVFTDPEIRRNYDLRNLMAGWEAELRELDVDVALLDPDSPLGYVLEQVEGWDVQQSDSRFAIMFPPRST